jgi:hypothetical protein
MTRYLLLCVWLTTLVGCSQVAPWERGLLAKEAMSLNPHPLHRAQRTHLHNSREAASGDDVAAGGGCGCY